MDAVLEQARAAGAVIGRAGAETFWGGYSGVFIDPDGHPWEVAHNPHWSLGPDGAGPPRAVSDEGRGTDPGRDRAPGFAARGP